MEPEKVVEVKKEQSGWDLLRFAIVALLIVIPVRIFIAQPFVVSGSSMFPTFQDKNYLIVDELTYKLSDPKRDDVIVFHYPLDPTKFFIKRIIGLPGETVDIKKGVVTITSSTDTKGFIMDEPYIHEQVTTDKHFELKEDEYFVMGDNRGASSDSRVWGSVPRKLIVGRAFLRLWPLNELNILPGKYMQTQ